MRFIFALGGPSFPDAVGGAERSIDELAGALASQGHPVEVVAAIPFGRRARTGYQLSRAVTRAGVARPDPRTSYPTFRAPLERVPAALRERIERFGVDVVVISGAGLAAAAAVTRDAGVTALLWLHHLDLEGAACALARSPSLGLAAVSAFVAERTAAHVGRPVAVLRPAIRLDHYRTARTAAPALVTFVNPVAHKGLEIALGVAARLQHRRFLFAESYLLGRSGRAAVTARLRAHPNVDFRPASTEMASVYARTAVLLVPSQWEEPFPRVVVEAQANGCPVVASRIGGLPEAVGNAGLLVDPTAPADEWADRVESVLGDPMLAARLAEAGRARAARHDVQPPAVARSLLELAHRICPLVPDPQT